MDHGDKIGMRTKKTVVKMTALLTVLFWLVGCGAKEAVPQLADKTVEETEKEDGSGKEDVKKEIASAVKETPVDFSFWSSALREEVDYFTLTLAELSEPAGEYELRLYNQKGDVLQQVPCGKLTEPIEITFGEFGRYTGSPVRYMEIFSAGSPEGVYIGWDDLKLRFEEAIRIPRYEEVRYEKMLTVEDGEKYQVRKVYLLDGREFRRSLLNKDTGEIEIWDCLDGESLFKGIAKLDKEGNPTNKEYYDFLMWEGLYGRSDDYDPKVRMDMEFEDGKWHEVDYESREAFWAEYGLNDREPLYQICDLHHNPRLELYKTKSAEEFCGILYRNYYLNSDNERWASMYGFTIGTNGSIKEKWSDNTYSKMTVIGPDDEEGYEETIEYTQDGKPAHFRSYGLAEVNDGFGIVKDRLPLMEIDYIYRDDGTLFYRDYWHTTYLYMTNDSSLQSFYDEKGRVVYEDGYITSGDQEYFYLYAEGRDVPVCKLDVYYSCHGGVSVSPTWYY